MNFKEELYQEDINKIACDLCDSLKELLDAHNIELNKTMEDTFFNNITDLLDTYSIGYRNHNQADSDNG